MADALLRGSLGRRGIVVSCPFQPTARDVEYIFAFSESHLLTQNAFDERHQSDGGPRASSTIGLKEAQLPKSFLAWSTRYS